MPYKDKEKTKQYNKQYNLEHKEHLIQYRLEHKKEIKQYRLEHKKEMKQYYLDNKEKILELSKQYYLDNKEKIKQYRLDNKEKILELGKQYRLGNKEKTKQYNKKYRLGHKEHRNQHQRERKKNDPNFKLAMSISSRMTAALKGISKSASTMELLGCTREEFWTHLEKSFYDCRITGEEMTRFNHGKWHVDHIIPCASFDLTDPEQQRICFNWKNYQPLWALDNMLKGAR